MSLPRRAVVQPRGSSPRRGSAAPTFGPPQFIAADAAVAAFANAPAIDAERFRARTSTRCSITTPGLVADQPIPRGIIDTSVVIDLEHVAARDPPAGLAVSAVTLAELAAGPHATSDPQERARRQDRLQRAEATCEPLIDIVALAPAT